MSELQRGEEASVRRLLTVANKLAPSPKIQGCRPYMPVKPHRALRSIAGYSGRQIQHMVGTRTSAETLCFSHLRSFLWYLLSLPTFSSYLDTTHLVTSSPTALSHVLHGLRGSIASTPLLLQSLSLSPFPRFMPAPSG